MHLLEPTILSQTHSYIQDAIESLSRTMLLDHEKDITRLSSLDADWQKECGKLTTPYGSYQVQLLSLKEYQSKVNQIEEALKHPEVIYSRRGVIICLFGAVIGFGAGMKLYQTKKTIHAAIQLVGGSGFVCVAIRNIVQAHFATKRAKLIRDFVYELARQHIVRAQKLVAETLAEKKNWTPLTRQLLTENVLYYFANDGDAEVAEMRAKEILKDFDHYFIISEEKLIKEREKIAEDILRQKTLMGDRKSAETNWHILMYRVGSREITQRVQIW